jgi:hypothetical protein
MMIEKGTCGADVAWAVDDFVHTVRLEVIDDAWLLGTVP